ncbi:Ubiquitin carboxyl-terminal hydrolase 12 [Dissophora globulifera]|uniref:Ubiquitin carboxyl-terminal hydrolase 12 n=1 Tax=Dissophora globulifera TaxID=979702 RepID=A0A9P6UNV8_9FUNG|nr:Ubiquitin carboxyl-terminal hydrolase 12 [Dissophora globulifera]
MAAFEEFNGSKLALRMKRNDGTLAPPPSTTAMGGSRKRKALTKSTTTHFTGYGVDQDQLGDLQDENQNTRNTSGGRCTDDGAVDTRSIPSIETLSGAAARAGAGAEGSSTPPLAKKHKAPAKTSSSTSELLKYFSKVRVNDQSGSATSITSAASTAAVTSLTATIASTKSKSTEATSIILDSETQQTGQILSERVYKSTLISEPVVILREKVNGRPKSKALDASNEQQGSKESSARVKPREFKESEDERASGPPAKAQHADIAQLFRNSSLERKFTVRQEDSFKQPPQGVIQDEINAPVVIEDKASALAPSAPKPKLKKRVTPATTKESAKPRKSRKSNSRKQDSDLWDSTQSGYNSDLGDDDSDDDDSGDSDFMTSKDSKNSKKKAKANEKPDPNQRSIATMFSFVSPSQPTPIPRTFGRLVRGRDRIKRVADDRTFDLSDSEDAAASEEQVTEDDGDSSGSEEQDQQEEQEEQDEKDEQSDQEEEVPDPRQRSITAMFAKAPLRPVSAFAPVKEPKRQLSQASQMLLSGGLSNISNTCYLNSVLQILRNTTGCVEVLFAIEDKILRLEEMLGSQVPIPEYQRSLFGHALEIFRSLEAREKRGGDEGPAGRPLYPKTVISSLRLGDSIFNSSEQQDAAEFLQYILGQFDDVLKSFLQQRQEQHSGAMAKEVKALIPEKWQPFDTLFQVGVQTVTHCQECPSVSKNVDRGIDLTVQIDVDHPTAIRDLDWGISETMRMEHMKDDNQRFCEKCNSKADAHVFHSFVSLPEIMILRLQRYNFKEGAIKLQNGVSCKERMSFKKWMNKDCNDSTDRNYELCAIIVHRGRVITSGHYYAYIRKDVEIETAITEPDGESRIEKKTYRWLKYNDASVDPISEDDMAKVFSGSVGALTTRVNDTASKDGADGGNEGTLGDGLPEVTLSTFFEDEVAATPYIYVYRRVDDDVERGED